MPVYLCYTSGAKPVAVRYRSDSGYLAVSVAAFVTAVTQQEQVLVIALPAHLTVLKNTNKCIH